MSTVSLHAALNRLAKWRSVFAGWQLGTRLENDPESRAVRDHREVTILLRAEVSALTGLIEKGVFTTDDWTDALEREAEQLNQDYANRFVGFTATAMGMSIDLEAVREHGTMDGWLP